MLQRVILSFRVRGNHNKINGVSNFVTKLIRLPLEKPVIISIITTPSPFIARVTTRHDGQGTSDQPPRNLRRKPRLRQAKVRPDSDWPKPVRLKQCYIVPKKMWPGPGHQTDTVLHFFIILFTRNK